MSKMYFEFKDNHFSLWVSKLISMEIVFLVTYLHMGYVTPDIVTGKLITLKNFKLYVCNAMKMLIDFNCNINHWSFKKILLLIFLKFPDHKRKHSGAISSNVCEDGLYWMLFSFYWWFMKYILIWEMNLFFHLQKWQSWGI